MSKFQHNEDLIKDICDDVFEQAKKADNKTKPLYDEILDKCALLDQEF